MQSISRRNVPFVPENVPGCVSEIQNVLGNVLQPATLRNIKETAFSWEARSAWSIIRSHYAGGLLKQLKAARAVYSAMTELASEQHTPTRLHTSYAYLGSAAGVSEATARKFAREFAALGLVLIQENRHQANDFYLLDPAAASLGATADTPTAANRRATDTPPPSTWVQPRTGKTTRIEIKESKTTTGVVVLADTTSAALPTTTAISSDVDEQAVKALTGLGVRRTVAEKIAATCPMDDITAWSRYAQRQASLKSKAGFVLAMLRAGERPPSPFGDTSGLRYQNADLPAPTQQRQARGLTEASSPPESETVAAALPAEQSAICNPHSIIQNSKLKTQNCEAANSALSTQHLALWQAAREELRGRLGNVTWAMWLQHMRLLAVEEGRAVLSAPPVGNFAQRYGGEVGTALGGVLGRAVVVEFVSGW